MTPLLPAVVRQLAHHAGLCRQIVGDAVKRHGETGGPVAVSHGLVIEQPEGGPPIGVAAAIFAMGQTDSAADGWSGVMCAPITNQQELNRARASIERFLDEAIPGRPKHKPKAD